MNPKDEFLSALSSKNAKVSFAADGSGRVIVKRVEPGLYDVFSRLQKLRCPNLPVILDIVECGGFIEVYEEYIRGRTVEQLRQETGALSDDTLLDIATDVCCALTACRIDRASIGADGDMTDDGALTIRAEGVYCVSGFIAQNGAAGDYVKATLVATPQPAAYTGCQCVLDVGRQASGLRTKGDYVASPDGSAYIQLYVEPHYVDRLCTASTHLKLYEFQGYCETEVEGADCGVTEDNRFYTDKPGLYHVYLPAFYRDEIIGFGTSIVITDGE